MILASLEGFTNNKTKSKIGKNIVNYDIKIKL